MHYGFRLLTLFVALIGILPAQEKSEHTNFVVFLVDDMGWGDSGTYGHPLVKTPNLDKLASQGVKFTQYYSACGVCSPSRSAILTGRTPYRNGVLRHLSGNHEAHLRTSEITYPTLLKKAGHENAKYMGNITQLDHALGQVMDALDQAGVADDTLLFFTSDNGPVARFGGTTGGLRGGKRSKFLTT